MKNKSDMYRVWRSKQTSGFCGTRVKVGMYSGESDPDKCCPNCGRRETAAHLMLCPDKDRTRLLLENVDKLVKWMEKDEKTDPELAYWIPKIHSDARRQTLLGIGTYVSQTSLTC